MKVVAKSRATKPATVKATKPATVKATKPATKPAVKKAVKKAVMKPTVKKAVMKPASVPEVQPTKTPSKKRLADKAAAAKNVAVINDTEPEAVKEKDAPRIECHLLIGDLAVTVDPSSLERTLGAGRWQNQGLVDAWPDTAWTGLLSYLDLPAFPLDRTAAAKPIKRLVQKLWYEAVNPAVLENRKDIFATRDAEAQSGYKEDFSHVKEAAEGKSERAKTSFGRSHETTYTPTAALKDKKFTANGQAAFLLKAFQEVKFGPLTTRTATDGMMKAGLKTTTKPERISAFYLCQFVKKGLLTR